MQKVSLSRPLANDYLLVAASLKVPFEGGHGPRIAATATVAMAVHVGVELITLKVKILASAPTWVFSPLTV